MGINKIKDLKNIIIIRLSSLGDIVMTSPVFEVLKKNYPESKITFISSKQFSGLMEANPHIDSIIYADLKDEHKDKNGLLRFIKDNNLQDSEFDLLIDLHFNLRSRFLSSKIKSKRKVHWSSDSLKRRLYVAFHIPFNIHPVTYRYLETIAKFIGEKDFSGFSYTHYADSDIMERILSNYPQLKDAILVLPGSQWFTKMYPKKYFIDLLKMFQNEQIYILGGPEEKELCDEIASEINSKSFASHFSLSELNSVISVAKAVITNDSGPMHISVGLGVPTIAFFGSTTRGLGFMPDHEDSLVIEDEKLSCRPCSLHGRVICPKKHFKCMNNLKPEVVFSKIQDWINARNSKR